MGKARKAKNKGPKVPNPLSNYPLQGNGIQENL